MTNAAAGERQPIPLIREPEGPPTPHDLLSRCTDAIADGKYDVAGAITEQMMKCSSGRDYRGPSHGIWCGVRIAVDSLEHGRRMRAHRRSRGSR